MPGRSINNLTLKDKLSRLTYRQAVKQFAVSVRAV